MENLPWIIAVDFDGTLCENKWPGIGAPNRELITYLQARAEQGVKLILWTNRRGQRLLDALRWCLAIGLHFDAVNHNLPEVIGAFGQDTRKVFANEYIDDRANITFRLPFVASESEVVADGETQEEAKQ